MYNELRCFSFVKTICTGIGIGLECRFSFNITFPINFNEEFNTWVACTVKCIPILQLRKHLLMQYCISIKGGFV